MELRKYKLGEIAKIEISGVDKKTINGEIPVRLCNLLTYIETGQSHRSYQNAL